MKVSCCSTPLLLTHPGEPFLDQIGHYLALCARHLLEPQAAPCGCCYPPGPLWEQRHLSTVTWSLYVSCLCPWGGSQGSWGTI